VQRFETVFQLYCDPGVYNLIKDETVRAQVEAGCNAFSALDPTIQSQSLTSLTPEQVSSTRTAAQTSARSQQRNISHRLTELRGGAQGVSINNLHLQQDGQLLSGVWLTELLNVVGGGASADTPTPETRLGLFLNGSISQGDRDGSTLERGFDLRGNNLTAGADYRFTDNLVSGLAIGHTRNTMEFTTHNDSTETNTTNLILYGSWFSEQFYVDAVIGTSMGDIASQRRIIIGNTVDATAKGDTDSKQVSLSLSINRDYQWQALTVSPYASFDWSTGLIEGYRETQAGGFGAIFNDQKLDSRLLSVGVRNQYALGMEWGILVPFARLEYRREMESDAKFISGRFLIDPTENRFLIEPDEIDSAWGQFALGLSAVLPHGLSAYIDYERFFGYENFNMHTFSFGGRWEANF
jgi:outer membrane autotransporter protein